MLSPANWSAQPTFGVSFGGSCGKRNIDDVLTAFMYVFADGMFLHIKDCTVVLMVQWLN